ncbi:unnamed protein product [Darwinula stevensoni]|uniref:Uncharacterized protein n=1 Tax=Darwinula stevensoni TaxID=69355 RepID=A0A7R8XIF5_9CRUS|nr:unnamed protein product [Darwinula stevensoni]CAG0891238.1 unnamed protein product [Darwinula stevensoni]
MEAEKLKIRQEYEAKMAALSRQYEAEQRSKEAMQHDVEALKRRYEQELAQLNEKITESQKQKPDQTEMAKKLEKLQGNLVGGEKANDTEFKERRVKRKKAAEKRMEALAMALSKVDEDDGAMLTKVYDDIHEDLQTKTDLAKKYKSRVKALESEIADLQSEFEKDRVDYLETIRKQDQQIMLFQQIMERVQPLIKKDTNYSNLERVKEEAVWEEETRRWRIPEVIITKVKFPPAGPPVNGVITAKRSPGSSQTAPGRICQDIDSDEGDPSDNVLYKAGLSLSPRMRRLHCMQQSDRFRLQKSAEENIAGTYFQPRRQQDILNKVQNDTTRVSDMWRDKAKSKSTSVLNKSLGQDELNGLNSSFSGSYGGPTSNSWSGASTSWIGGMSLSPDMSIRRPLRLQALPSHTNKTTRHRGGKQPVNTMDII